MPDYEPESQPSPYPWRLALPTWPDEWRERWGLRANELAESGTVYPDDERLAFEEVKILFIQWMLDGCQ